MSNYINQYKLLFGLSWIILYLVFPAWTLPISVTARFLLFSGLMIFFSISAFFMHLWFNALPVDRPLIIYPEDFSRHLKNHAGLLILCSIAALLHISPLSSPIYLIGDEALFLQGGLWIYDYFGSFWHNFMRYAFWAFWVFIISFFIVTGKRNKKSGGWLSSHKSRISTDAFFMLSTASLLLVYFVLLSDLPHDSLMVRYPPVQKLLYLVSYFVVGINYIGPRLIQLIFYILSAVYLYRTINLFSDRETALLGASIYLFSPIIFVHAHFAELPSGVLFFIILISYYFLRYLIFEDNRGLILASYFTGIGFLYKRDIFLMFFICFAYLLMHNLKKRKLHRKTPFKILTLSLVNIVPWMIIGHFFTWRNAAISLSQFTSFEKITAYFLMIPSQISWGLFIILLIAIVYVLLFKRSTLSLFSGFLFITFYLFYTSQFYGQQYPRFMTAFYPAIAIYLALFLGSAARNLKWKYSFGIIFFVITVYLIVLCAVPSLSARLITYKSPKTQLFPAGKAMEWIRDNVGDGEKILSLRFKPDLFYRDKYGINKNSILSFWYHLGEVSTPQKLKAFSRLNNISYVVFPYGPNFLWGGGNKAILDYLKENRNNEFIQAAAFNLEENYIYIYRLRTD